MGLQCPAAAAAAVTNAPLASSSAAINHIYSRFELLLSLDSLRVDIDLRRSSAPSGNERASNLNVGIL